MIGMTLTKEYLQSLLDSNLQLTLYVTEKGVYPFKDPVENRAGWIRIELISEEELRQIKEAA